MIHVFASVKYLFIMIISGIFGKTVSNKPLHAQAKTSIYDLKATDINGKEVLMSQFKGKKLLIVNVASECGYTPQYKELQQLHEKYGNKVTVIAFPANNFGGQEPGTNSQIAGFCKKNYGVTFALMAKISVVSSDQHPIYQWLTDKNKNGWNDQAPTWNFCKYLISENGELLKFYKSGVSPLSEAITAEL